MYIKTDREFYYPGNTVFGKIYIRINPDYYGFDASHLEIRIKGYEKTKFSTFR